MPKSLQAIGNDALQNAPKPLQRVLHGLDLRFQQESGPTAPMAGGLGPDSQGMIAGVERGRPNTISVMQPDVFAKNADQLTTHEGVHEAQNNWAPAIQSAIPPDNPKDPYNYGGDQGIKNLLARGGTIANMPREQAAAAMQYGQVQGMPEPYKSLANTMNSIPMSQIDMTDPNAKTINTHPRAPLPPIMNYAQDTYQKGQPAPGDALKPPAPPRGWETGTLYDLPPVPYAKNGPYVTQLAPAQENGFQQWTKQNHVPWQDTPTADYDMRGYYKALQSGDSNAKQQMSGYDGTMHFPDTYKTPFHKTFSNESEYATPDAPHWAGDRLMSNTGKLIADETPKKMNYATDTYKKGQPAPGDDDIDLSAGLSPAHVTTGTVGGHAPDNTPAGVAQGQSNPSAADDDIDLSAGLSGAQQNTDEPYSMQLFHGIPGAAKSIGTGILKGLGSDAANLTGSDRLKALTAISGDENDQAGQKFGKGLEQGAEFLIPGLGEEAAVSKLGKLAPLGKLAYNAATTAALNKAQGGDATTGAIAGGIGSIGGQLLEKAAPAVAEQALGIRGRVDRAFNKEPGRAVLDEIKGVRPDTIAENARSRISELNQQVEQAADAASTRPNALRGLLPAPAEAMPLHSAPDVAGTPSRPVVLNQADRPSRLALMPPEHDIPLSDQPFTGHFAPDEGLRQAPISNSRVAEPMTTPEGNPNYGYSDQMPSTEGQWTGGVLRRRAMPEGEASGLGQGQYIGQIPGESGGPGQTQGVFMRRPAGGGAPIPSVLPNRIASLAPARGIVSDAMGSAARQNAEGAFGQLEGMGNFLNRQFLSGENIPSDVTPRQLLDLRRGFNEEFGQWNPERKDATINTGRRAYSALSNELHNTLPDIAPLDARISNLIPVKNRAQVKALGDDTVARTLGRIARPTGALAGLGTGAYVGGKEGGTAGAIEGGLLGLVLPELMSSPTGQMVTARTLNRAGALRPLVGAGLQLDRRPQQ